MTMTVEQAKNVMNLAAVVREEGLIKELYYQYSKEENRVCHCVVGKALVLAGFEDVPDLPEYGIENIPEVHAILEQTYGIPVESDERIAWRDLQDTNDNDILLKDENQRGATLADELLAIVKKETGLEAWVEKDGVDDWW